MRARPLHTDAMHGPLNRTVIRVQQHVGPNDWWTLSRDGNRAGIRGALSLASPGVPGNCQKQCSVPGSSLGAPHGRTRGTDGNIERACVVRYFRQNTMEETIMKRMINLCKSCNSMIVSFAHFILIIKHVGYCSHELTKNIMTFLCIRFKTHQSVFE